MQLLTTYFFHGASIIILAYYGKRNGMSRIIPFFVFMVIVSPMVAKINLLGLFDITIQRSLTVTLIILYLLDKKNIQLKNNTYLGYLIVLSFIWGIISNLNSIVPVISFKRMLSFLVEYYVIYFILVKRIVNDNNIKRILIAIQFGITVVCILGIIEYFTSWSPKNLFPYDASRFSFLNRNYIARVGRISSTFPHPILFGSTIAMTIPITFYLIVSESGWKKIFFQISLFLALFCLWKTGSRGPMLATIIAVSFLFISLPKGRKYIILTAISFLLILIIKPGIWMSLKNMVYATLDPTTQLGSSYEYRYALYELIINVLAENPLRLIWGYGQESFFYLGLETEFSGYIHRFLSCDSSWAEILIESGYIGLLITLIIFSRVSISCLINFYKFNYTLKFLFLIFFSSMLVFFFMMTNVDIYGWGQTGHILWIIIALNYALMNHLNRIQYTNHIIITESRNSNYS